MNNNFTHKEFKNFITKVSDFLSILTNLPAGLWHAANFLFVQYNNLFKLPAISKFSINKPELKLQPVFATNELYGYKKANK